MTDEVTARLGGRVRRLRNDREWSQAELARRVGVTQGQIAKIERGDRSARLSTAARLADALGVGLDDLLGRDESPPDGMTEAVVQRVVGAVRAVLTEGQAVPITHPPARGQDTRRLRGNSAYTKLGGSVNPFSRRSQAPALAS